MKRLPLLSTVVHISLLGALVALGARLCRPRLGDLSRQLVGAARRSEALERRRQSILRCQQAQDRVAADLFAGKLTLREAALRFGELQALLDEGGDGEIPAFQRPEGERALCEAVIIRALARWHGDPERAAAALVRLEQEYQDAWPRCQLTISPELLPPARLSGCRRSRHLR